MAIESNNLLVAIKAYARANALPLDASEIYESMEEAEVYAGQANAYAGQIIKVLVEDKYIPYILQPDGNNLILKKLDSSDQYIQVKSLNEWEQESNQVYVPGTLLIYTDRTTVDNVPIPDIKIADGVKTVSELPFLNDKDIQEFLSSNNVSINNGTVKATTFDGKMNHKLTIGNLVYDGSVDVNVPVYKGE